MSIRLGFVGAGKHARANLYPSLQLLGQPVAAVATTRVETAQAAARELGIPASYGSYEAMVEAEALDAVVVAAAPQDQARIVGDLLERGLHVFVEKPLGYNAAEAREVAVKARTARRHLMVGFMKRFAPAYAALKEQVQSATLGDLVCANGVFTVRAFGNDPTSYLRLSAIHYVDLITFLLGEIAELTGYQKATERGVCQMVTLRSRAGVLANLTLIGEPSWARHYEELTVTGEAGFAKVENQRSLVLHRAAPQAGNQPRWQLLDERDEELTFIDTSSAGGSQALFVSGFVGELQHFLQSVRANTAPEPSADDNIRTTQLCDEILALPLTTQGAISPS